MDIGLSLKGSIFFFLVLIALCITGAVWSYNRSNPPVRGVFRNILIGIRSLSLILIIFLLFEPIVSITSEREERANFALLIDTSSSMSIPDESVDRSEAVKELLTGIAIRNLSEKFYMRRFKFHSSMEEIDPGDTLRFDSEGTNIAHALKEVQKRYSKEHLKGILLITDGGYNLGENPARVARDLGVPCYVAGIGDSSDQRDIMIRKVSTNSISYINNIVPVEVTVAGNGVKGEKTTLILSQGREMIESQLVDLPDNFREIIVKMYLQPKEEGMQRFDLDLSPLDGELTTKNNSYSFMINVLKDKIRLLVIAGSPGADYSFFIRSLEKDELVEVIPLVERKGGGFYQKNPNEIFSGLHEFDTVILLGYPTRSSRGDFYSRIKESIKKEKHPVLVMFGKGIASGTFDRLKEILPGNMVQVSGGETEVYPQLTPAGKEDNITQVREFYTDNEMIWLNLPPIYNNGFIYEPAAMPAGVLVQIDAQRSRYPVQGKIMPLIVAEKIGQQKFIIWNGYGYWRWSFLLAEDDRYADFYDAFLGNCVRWLVRRDEDKLVQITLDKELYQSGEEVMINAQVYDTDYTPRDDAAVSVRIKHNSVELEKPLKSIGSGKYEGRIEVLEAGDYEYVGEAFVGDRRLGEDSGKFIVGAFSIEMMNTRMDVDLLRRIAANSGGEYVYYKDFKSFAENIHIPVEYIKEKKDIIPGNAYWFLLFIIGSLTGEWFLRKRLGML